MQKSNKYAAKTFFFLVCTKTLVECYKCCVAKRASITTGVNQCLGPTSPFALHGLHHCPSFFRMIQKEGNR